MYRKLEGLLIENNISKQYLAKLLGITYNTLLLKMNGKSRFTLDESFKIKDILNTTLTLEELFQIKDKINRA